MHKSLESELPNYYIYMKDEDNVVGVLSAPEIHEKKNVLSFSMGIFNKTEKKGLPPYFDVYLVSKDDVEIIIQKYEECYIMECESLMYADSMEILEKVKIYYKQNIILDINRDI